MRLFCEIFSAEASPWMMPVALDLLSGKQLLILNFVLGISTVSGNQKFGDILEARS
jgi:hypothetical protein